MRLLGLDITRAKNISLAEPQKRVQKPVLGIKAAEKKIGGYLDDKYEKPSTLEWEDLKIIRQYPTVKIALWFFSMVMQKGFGDYLHADPTIQQFVRDNMERIHFRKYLKKILSYRWVGASLTEMIWEYIDGKWQVVELVGLHPETWFDSGLPKSSWDPILQSDGGMKPVEIPQNKVIILRNDGDYVEDGSILDGAVKTYWESAIANYASWSITVDQYARPKTEVIHDSQTGLHGANELQGDLEEENDEYYAELTKKIHEATCYHHGDDVEIKYQTIPKAPGDIFLQKLHYDDKMIMRSMLLPNLLLEGSDMGAGSRALGETHYKFFWDYAQAEMNMFGDSMKDQFIRPLLDYNFPNIKDYGKFNIDDIEVKDYAMWKEIFLGLTNMGVLAPSVNQAHRKLMLDYFNLLNGQVDITELLDNSIIPPDDQQI
jgi:hypothetical protein